MNTDNLIKNEDRDKLEVGKMYGGVQVLEYMGYNESTLIRRGGRRDGQPYQHRNYMWKVKCSICGNEKIMHEGNIKVCPNSCGCNKFSGLKARAEGLKNGTIDPVSGSRNGMYKHGASHGSKLYNVWKEMRHRCSNPNHKSYKDYGGRGITVCSEWTDPENGFENFKRWAESKGYLEGSDRFTSIDRINVNGNYSPENCSWAGSMKSPQYYQQANNTRANHMVNWGGVEYTVAELVNHFGVENQRVRNRLSEGKSIEEAILLPKSKTGTASHNDLRDFMNDHPLVSDGDKIIQNPNAVNPFVSCKYPDLINTNDPKLNYYSEDTIAAMRGISPVPQETEEEYQKAREAAKQALIEKLKNQ